MKPFTFSKSKVALSLTCALFASSSFASSIAGKIASEEKNVFFQGARVTIEALNRSTVSARDGSFKLTNLPAGTYTLQVDYIGAKSVRKTVIVGADGTVNVDVFLQSDDVTLEDVIVIGQRAGQAGALNRQKNALGIKSIVSSDSIGQLPDQNAAEALQRLPGMFIQRDQGEGRFVGIRGIDPNLNNVTINGANLPSPEAGVRSVAMDVIPSELIQSLEVSKTVTPDMDASAIGGSIEVKSLSAFDRDGTSYSASVQNTYNAQVEKSSPKLSASYSDVFELSKGYDFGIASALSWSQRRFGSHNMETDGGWYATDLQRSNGNTTSVLSAEEIEQRHYTIERERLGGAINLDLKDEQGNLYYLKTLVSEFSDDEYRLRNEYKFDKGELVASELSANSALFQSAKMDRDTKDRFEEQQVVSIVTGAEHQLNEWVVEYSLGYSKSNEKEPNRLDTSFAGKGFWLGYASLGEKPTLSASDDAFDLNKFSLDEVVVENNFSEDESTSFKLDLSKDLVIANYNAQLKFGAKYTQREKLKNADIIVFDGGFDEVVAEQFKINEPNYDLGKFGSGLSQNALKNFVKLNRSSFETNHLESNIKSAGGSYTSEEQIGAAYLMLTMDIGQWQVISGLRYETTDFNTNGNRVELVTDEVNDIEQTNISKWHANKDYDHLLPNLTVRYEYKDNLITRFAYTSTLARPKFSDSAAFAIIETDTSIDDGVIEIERKAEVGNPELDPYESNNLDFSIEYYLSGVGVISAGLFYKDISNFIAIEQVQGLGVWSGYKEVMQARNGGSADLNGVELAFSKNFSNGLMFSSNATFIDADHKLQNQSDTVANVMLGYENDLLSTRLSASYKSKSFQHEEQGKRVYQDAHLQLDLSAKYNITEQFQLYFNAINLTDEPYYLYHGAHQYNYQYESYGRSYEFGVSFNSL
ncbi:TonB-dependent receptor [Pseudoalteromonas sp. JBTF-M23]|uniref:TonB-dependent receptor n=1 Tax=Pseudoalteromonas caenipelagi TaxID=2726988 RepID=A0A849VBU8_9GAMM|nr:TonB-dependent receptor [Pseudoalteromonas caenipelagi]NOU49171.1 TonB-dependent receptor [Pseudoalteromonas caenipelagi]